MSFGETDLTRLLRSILPELHHETYVFATTRQPLNELHLNPRMTFRETEGTTLIITRHEAESNCLSYVFPCRMITLNIHSALDAVGFIAAVATRLAGAGLGVNPVAGFYHDHLFVAEDQAHHAMDVLDAMVNE